MQLDGQRHDSDTNVRYLSLDPGGRTGWAEMQNGVPLRMGIVQFPDIWRFLERSDWDTVSLFVIENYRIRPKEVARGGYEHRWDDGKALRIIGAVESKAHRQGVELRKQEPGCLRVAAGHIGFPFNPRVHINDQHSAVLHGVYYWFKEHGPYAQNEHEGSSKDTEQGGNRRPARVEQIRSYSGLRKKGH